MDTFTDSRDGETYKIVKIGSLLWFAENLRYRGVEYHFPDRDSDNVPQCGCLYTWENAKSACPDGWRLPTKDELQQLLLVTDAYDNTSSLRDPSWENGSNSSGFGALPAGDYCTGSYNYFGSFCTCFWSSTEGSDISSAAYLFLSDDSFFVICNYKTFGFSVRCVKEV